MSSSSTVAGILCVYWTWISQLQSTSRLAWQLAHQIPGSITGILPGLIHANGVCRPGMISSISIWPRPAAIHARLQIQKQWNRLDGRMTLAGEALRVLGVTSWLQKRVAVESNGATRLSASQNGCCCCPWMFIEYQPDLCGNHKIHAVWGQLTNPCLWPRREEMEDGWVFIDCYGRASKIAIFWGSASSRGLRVSGFFGSRKLGPVAGEHPSSCYFAIYDGSGAQTLVDLVDRANSLQLDDVGLCEHVIGDLQFPNDDHRDNHCHGQGHGGRQCVEYVQEHLHKLGPWEIINAGNDHSAQNDQNG